MQSIVAERHNELSALCRRAGVRRLELFGSGARDDFDPARSDLDFVVEFEPNAPGSALQSFFAFRASLEQLFDRPVDLVESGAVRNPYIRETIERDKQLVYAA